jgi:hypothetical protein
MVLFALCIKVYCSSRARVELQIFLQVRFQCILELGILPITCEGGLDLGEYTQSVDSPELKLLDSHIIKRRAIIARDHI